ncbi:MAG: hypothetical protein FJ179_10795 [Gammaproteobacteria bacterium]|nr:hypothetical protein [Gammaproteobacteria bacterium]
MAGFLLFQIELDEYRKIFGLVVVSSVLAYSIAVNKLDDQVADERRDMLQTIFVWGVVDSTFVYRDAETIDQVFSRIREAVTNNTRGDFYNDVCLWDFDELLAECLKDLRSDVDSNIRAESNLESEKS